MEWRRDAGVKALLAGAPEGSAPASLGLPKFASGRDQTTKVIEGKWLNRAIPHMSHKIEVLRHPHHPRVGVTSAAHLRPPAMSGFLSLPGVQRTSSAPCCASPNCEYRPGARAHGSECSRSAAPATPLHQHRSPH